MANELGIGQSAYQKIESGDSKVSIERLKQIADILGRSVENFLVKDEKTNQKIENSNIGVNITKAEHELTQKIILQQEKRIEELEGKVARKDAKIEELKSTLALRISYSGPHLD